MSCCNKHARDVLQPHHSNRRAPSEAACKLRHEVPQHVLQVAAALLVQRVCVWQQRPDALHALLHTRQRSTP